MKAEDSRGEINDPPHLLHVFPSFGIGGMPLRIARTINAIGPIFRHTIVALDGDVHAAKYLGSDILCSLTAESMPSAGLIGSLRHCSAKLRQHRPDLLITYNWGAIEWALAHLFFCHSPHIHHEAGFGREEAERQIYRRVWFRRIVLRHAHRVVVPSRGLEKIAREMWWVPRERLMYIPNGIDASRFAKAAEFHRHQQRTDCVVVGTVSPLRPEKNIARLIRAFALARQRAGLELVVSGDGQERANLEDLVHTLGIASFVKFTGFVEPEEVLSYFDIFALSSDTEQMPNSILEAMASGLPIAAVAVGDVRSMVAVENQSFIVPGDDVALAGALVSLAADPDLRRRIGRANLAVVHDKFSYGAMVAAWLRLFREPRAHHTKV